MGMRGGHLNGRAAAEVISIVYGQFITINSEVHMK